MEFGSVLLAMRVEKDGTYHKTGACTDDECGCGIAKTTFFVNPG